MVTIQHHNDKEISNSSGLENDENSLLFLANKSYQEKRFADALNYLKKLVINFPQKPEYISGLAIIQKNLGDYKEAEINYRKALEINPGLFEGYYNLGNLSYETENIDEAEKLFLKALEIKPDLYQGYYNLGNIYRERNEFRLSIEFYKKAIYYKKDYDDAYYNLGVVWEKVREFDKAVECYQNAIQCNNNNINAHWNLGLLYLLTGNFLKGWPEYEIRKEKNKSGKRIFSRPELKSEPVNGKRILVYSEQGMGDSIQFARYLKMLKNCGAYVIFECKPKLAELFKNFNGFDELIVEKKSSEIIVQYDYQISMLSLPNYFDTTVESIPSEISYLSACPEKVKQWEKIIKDENYLNIGIVWSGAEKNISGKDRSCTLNDFEPLFLIKGIKLYSLQKSGDNDNTINPDLPVISFDNLDSVPFLDTAAIIENLDLVISIDTSVAHLAGALGKPIWTLLPYYPDWRWLLNRNDSPWYPSMKLFRQQEPGNWHKVFSIVADEIKNIVILKKKNIGTV
jgi:Flp pilus assembly protein TadD